MSILPWSSLMSVHNELIDSQHKQLLDMINDVDVALEFGRSSDIFIDVFPDLLAVAKKHFWTEEQIMAAACYNGLDNHRKEHSSLIQKMTDINTEIAHGNAVDYKQVCAFLGSWMATHMMGEDQEYIDAISILSPDTIKTVSE